MTFGSPIGLITWLWLFLDFTDFDFGQWREVNTYFCWSPEVNTAGPLTPVKWINVINCLDPIASGFPDQAADFSRSPAELQHDLQGGGVIHRYCGPAKFSATGRAHTGTCTIVKAFSKSSNARPVCSGGRRKRSWATTGRSIGSARHACSDACEWSRG